MTLSELGIKVAAWRKGKKMTQAEFCEAAGISTVTLSQLENGDLLELGFNKVQRVLSCVGKELSVRDASPVPTFDERLRENKEEWESSFTGPGGPR